MGPLYLRLQRLIGDAVASGRLAPDEALPSERCLADDFGLSRITVRKAISGLVAEERLVRRHGAGTFVARPAGPRTGARVEKVFSKLSSFSEDMIARGLRPSSRWLSKSAGVVTPDEAMSLALSPGAAVYRLRRLRFADGKPMAIERTVLPGHYLPGLDAIGTSLYEALERQGCRPTRALQRLRAVTFDDAEAEALEVRPGDAGLLIERRGFLPDGRPVEITRSLYRGDSYDFVAELSE